MLEPSGLKLYIKYKRFLVIGASGKSKPYNLQLLLIFSLSLIFILFCMASTASKSSKFILLNFLRDSKQTFGVII